MTKDRFKPWHLPLSPEAKAEAAMRINHRHATLLAVGPAAFAKMGRDDKDRFKAIQLLNHGYESALYTEPEPD